MLERTATSLEPCKLQRVLPSTKGTWKNHRQLRSSFWKHGASDIELYDACQNLLRPPSVDLSPLPTLPPQTESEIKLGSMTASAFLLDFLYPQGAASLLRRISPVTLERGGRPAQRFGKLGPGMHAAIASSSRSQGPSASLEDGPQDTEKSHSAFIEDLRDGGDALDSGADAAAESTSVAKPQSNLTGLVKRMRRRALVPGVDAAYQYNQVWERYHELDDDKKVELRQLAIHKLAKSTRPVEAWRALELFSLYKLEEWTEVVVRDVVTVGLKAGEPEQAISVFKKAVESRGLIKGIDSIVAYALTNSNWDLLIQSWEAVLPYVVPTKEYVRVDNIHAEAHGDEATLSNTNSTVVSPAKGDPSESVEGSSSPDDFQSGFEPANPSRDELGLVATSMPGGTMEQPTQWRTERTRPFLIKFQRVSEVEDLRQKIRGLYSYVRSWEDSLRAQQVKEKLDSLFELMLLTSLHHFGPLDAQFLANRSKNLLVSYPRLVKAFIQKRHDKLAVEYYRRYRQLPGSNPKSSLLPAIFGLVYRFEARTIGTIRDEWRKIGDELIPNTAYAQLIQFYTSRGDVHLLYELWDRCSRLSREGRPDGSFMTRQAIVDDIVARGDAGILTNFMHAHAMRGNTGEVNYLLAQALKKTQQPPTITQYNILLQAYVRNRDYRGAVDVFVEICDHSKPDLETFEELMQLTSQLGDLEFCLDLFRVAKQFELRPSVQMVSSVIEAYCRNERYHDAEVLCRRATEQAYFSKQRSTSLWNSLIRHHGLRRDLGAVNHLLNEMSKFKLPYNNETYNGLLVALINCRQSHHALHLLQTAKLKQIFEPTLHHYMLLMTAFIRTGEPDMVLKVHDALAKNQDLSDSAKLMTSVISAYGKWAKMPRNQYPDKSGEWFVGQALRTFRKSLGRGEQVAVDDPRSASLQYAKMVSILAEARDFVSAGGIVELYKKQFAKRATDEGLPIHLLSSMMLADYYEHKFSRAKKTWDMLMRQITEGGRLARDFLDAQFNAASGRQVEQEEETSASRPVSAVQENSPTAPGAAFLELPWTKQEANERDVALERKAQLLPALRYYLNEPLKTMQRILVVEKDADGLQALFKRVTDAGFEIDSPNWNYYVQAQARLKHWEEAFKTCETKLMPNWGGWARERMSRYAKRQLPLEKRRLGRADSYLRPISHTLMVLTKEYIEIEKISLWSTGAARLMKMITTECPMVVAAATTLVRDPESSLESAIFSGGWDPESDDLSGVVKSMRPYYDEDMKQFPQGAAVEGDEQPPETETPAGRKKKRRSVEARKPSPPVDGEDPFLAVFEQQPEEERRTREPPETSW